MKCDRCERWSDYRFNVKLWHRMNQRSEYYCERHALDRIDEASRDPNIEIMSKTKR
ncbi:hypothetical protein [Natronosalvus halobius]|uniref:hypothetical protein n=1 Tax=Natronosalvus halobius TaxID=2953746 RepID=UPI00209CA1B7|nr:hypothetical protein [Natronosalvus halobius]USZ73758.1 hypothetical protein NGM15_18650 [Natronosalvus halobius]